MHVRAKQLHLYDSILDLFQLHREKDVCAANSTVHQEFVMRIAFNLAAAFVSSAVIMLAVI